MHLLIIGNGVAGVTAAMTARKRDVSLEITLVSDESDYFFSRTALMYAFLDRLSRRDLEPYERKVWDRQGIRRVRGRVVDLDAEGRTVTLDGGATLAWDRLILATGAGPRMLPLEGLDEIREGVVHFVTLADLDRCEALTPSTQRAVVVGGGLIGIELAECLHHHGVAVTLVLRDDRYWPTALPAEESAMVVARMREHGIEVIAGDTAFAVAADEAGRVREVRTHGGRVLPCEMLGVCIGVEPRIEALRTVRTAPALGRGVLVDDHLRTSLPDVYACGDCAEVESAEGERFIETIWYSARAQGEVAGENAAGGTRAYRRPIFYNSAMLIDIPYTTVGRSADLPPETPTLLRRAPGRPLSQRLLEGPGGELIGFIGLGSDWDHELLERWIREQRPVAWVRDHLHRARYDVEFRNVRLDRMDEVRVPLHGGEVST
ncbi:MAG: FAD-dependent oxidoreductase [Deltaproteobacteria bacterium]|nr:MAG: FAD-dependent oxidoreductase [Deltaproteobacteria bacterium]